MKRRVLSGIMLTLLLISMLTLAFDIQLVRAESTDRKVGVNVGYWIQYGVSVTWESNDPNATIPQYVLDSQQLVFFSNVVQSVSGTNVTFDRIMLFKNGTEKSETLWIDVDTGRGSGYLFFIAANLSAGDIIYTGLGKGIGEINETITRTYLGEPVEINHSNGTTSNSYFIYSDIYWNKATGVLYEFYINHTKYTTKGEETYVIQETQLLYPIGVVDVARTWTVNDDGPADFHTIQEAINAASSGDTIFVHSGTYYENVVVNKTVTVVGENSYDTIIDGGGTPPVVRVTSHRVEIRHFTIRNSGRVWNGYGLELNNVRNCSISENNISDNHFGIWLLGSSRNSISGNILTNSTANGIYALRSPYNSIHRNSVANNWRGIKLEDSPNNHISGNNVTDNTYGGVDLILTSFTTIHENNIAKNSKGVVLGENCSGNIIVNNDFTLNGEGFTLFTGSYSNFVIANNITRNYSGGECLYSDNNTISRNNIANNEAFGIGLGSSEHNIIEANNITSSSWGILLFEAFNNTLFHNNFANNTKGVFDISWEHPAVSSMNTWDNGYPSGGNHWSDYESRYPDAEELDGSGIWNMPYIIDERNQDNYPLMEPWSPKPSSPLEATQELIETIETWKLTKGTENSLKAKLKVAIHMLDLGKEDGAIRKLTAFINRVEMLREKTLTNEQADELVLEAQRIIYLING